MMEVEAPVFEVLADNLPDIEGTPTTRKRSAGDATASVFGTFLF